jgi:tetratricopeptide (TPR) repeat protein
MSAGVIVETEFKEDLDTCLALVKQQQYPDALERIKLFINRNPSAFADIMSHLYKRLTAHFDDVGLRLLIAELYITVKAYDSACDELENILDFAPNHAQVFYLFSKIYKHCSHQNSIQTIFENAFSNTHLDPAIIDLLPVIYMEKCMYAEGILFFEKLIHELNQPHLNYRKSLSEFYLKAGRFDDYADCLLRIVQDAPDDISLYTQECQSVLKRRPECTEIRKALVTLLIKGMKPSEAVEQLRVLLDLDGTSTDDIIVSLKYLLSVFPDHPTARLMLADCHILNRHYADAVDLLRSLTANLVSDDLFRRLDQILIQMPEFVSALELSSDLYFQLGRYQESLGVVISMIDLDIRDDAFIVRRLRELMRQDTTMEAICRLKLAEHALLTDEMLTCETEARQLLGTEYDLPGRLMMSSVFEKSNRFIEAQEMLFSALDLHVDHIDVHVSLKNFQTHSIHRLIQQKTSQTFIGEAPPEHHFSLGVLYMNHGLLYPALDHFQKLTQHPSYMIDAQILISRCFMELGRYDLSLSQLNRLFSKVSEFDYPLRNRLAYLMAVSYLHVGNPQEALNQLEYILENDIKFPNVQHILSQLKEENLLDFRGLIVTGCSSFISEGSPEWSLMAVHNPENDDLYVNTSQPGALSFAHPHNQQGVVALLKDNTKTAEESFKLAIQMDPQLTAAYCNLAMVKLIQEELDAALYYLSKAQSINPKLDAIYITRGLIYASQNQWDSALNQFEDCLSLNPKHGIALLNLGDVYFQLNDMPRALQFWKKALDSGLLFPFLHRRLFYLNPKLESQLEWTSDYKLSFVPFYHGRGNAGLGLKNGTNAQSHYSGMPLFDYLPN